MEHLRCARHRHNRTEPPFLELVPGTLHFSPLSAKLIHAGRGGGRTLACSLIHRQGKFFIPRRQSATKKSFGAFRLNISSLSPAICHFVVPFPGALSAFHAIICNREFRTLCVLHLRCASICCSAGSSSSSLYSFCCPLGPPPGRANFGVFLLPPSLLLPPPLSLLSL